MKSSRLVQMEEFIKEQQQVSLEALCDTFGRSMPTIRRDVAEITRDSRFEKVYGGVRYAKPSIVPLSSFQDRSRKNVEQKSRICARAATHIQNGDVVFIDSGSTVVDLLRYLEPMDKVTVLTNNLYVAIQCLDRADINLIVPGGQLHQATASLSANFCNLDNLSQMNINKAFVSATGVSMEKGATHTTTEELAIKKRVVEISDSRLLLADHTKFGQSALLTYAALDRFQYVITDCPPPSGYREFFLGNGTVLEIAE